MIETRVSIRPFVPPDAEALCVAVRGSIAEISPWLEWCHSDYSINESRTWIDHCIEARAEQREYNFAILGVDDVLLGGCGLNRLQHDHRVANLGYWVRTTAVGRGVATVATRLLAEFAFRHTDLNRLEIITSTNNIGSQRVAERVGARHEAAIRGRLIVHGVSHDAIQYALARADYRAGPERAE